jgi:hypothetical protein
MPADICMSPKVIKIKNTAAALIAEAVFSQKELETK